MTSTNKTLEELKKDAKEVNYGTLRDDEIDYYLDRAFQFGRMEQYDKDVSSVCEIFSNNGEKGIYDVASNTTPDEIYRALASVSPVEGEE